MHEISGNTEIFPRLNSTKIDQVNIVEGKNYGNKIENLRKNGQKG